MPPGSIAVDLTPVLPGGENGGAKVFALALIERLAALAPGTRFILLTQDASHDELARLDRENVRRVKVVGAATTAMRPALFGNAARVLAPLPAPLKRAAAQVGYRLHSFLKRGMGNPLGKLGVDLLFCPFTAPTFHDARVPAVCTVYDLQFRAYPQFFAVEDAVQRERAFLEACGKARALAAISDFTRDATVAEGRVDPAKVRTIHLRLARPAGDRPGGSTGALGRLGLETGKYLLYPANFWKHKNHEMLLTAFGIARGAGLPADVKLVCTGTPGVRQEWLARAARQLGLGDSVAFPGFVPDADMEALLDGCLGLVYPSLHEGFGLPVIDAMGRGIPVACSATTALPEIAAGAALLFDPRVPQEVAAALVSLATDTALRERLIAAGRRRAAEFADTDRMAREYLGLFAQALQPARG